MPSVTNVNINTAKGTRKSEVPLIRLVRDHGIEGDAHAGNWHRQISMLAEESVDTMRAVCSLPLTAGAFAENINTEGIDLNALPVGTHLIVQKHNIRYLKLCNKTMRISNMHDSMQGQRLEPFHQPVPLFLQFCRPGARYSA